MNNITVPPILKHRLRTLLEHCADVKVMFIDQHITLKRFGAQLCDMPVAVQRYLHTATRLHACDSTTGWFHQSVLKRVRELLTPCLEAAILSAETESGLATAEPSSLAAITVSSTSRIEPHASQHSGQRENNPTPITPDHDAYEPFQLLGSDDDDDDSDDSEAEGGVLFMDV